MLVSVGSNGTEVPELELQLPRRKRNPPKKLLHLRVMVSKIPPVSEKATWKKRWIAGFCILGTWLSQLQWARGDDLLPPAPAPKTDEKLDQDIARRRTQLQWHQGVGYALLPTMAATAVLGQLRYNDDIEGLATGKWVTPHRIAAITAGALFVTNAILAFTAPEPFKKSEGLDKTKIHKWTMIVTGLAMAAQIGLGIAAHNSRGTSDEESLAKMHMGLGWATVGLTFAGASVHLF